MKLNLIPVIEILTLELSVIYDNSHNGGSFDLSQNTIVVGTKDIEDNSLYTFGIISHEVMEILLILIIRHLKI